MNEPILKVENMNKKFGSTIALNNVSLTVYPGEIRGLIGENGSGKSTVTSIVAGMQPCDSGTMTFKGQDWKPLSMIDALHRGIGMIVQESGTIQGITVAENIFLAETEKYRNKLGLINRKKMNSDATAVMKNIGVNDVTGDMLMQKLDFQTRKLVEIAKVIMKEPQILVIDETSTALSHDGNQIYYAVAAGMLDDDQYEQYKGNEYFLGQVGPSMETEYQAGVDMGKFFADKGIKTVAMYGAFIPNPMHVYRVAGVLSGLGLSYDGSTDEAEVVGKIFADQGVDPSKVSGDIEMVAYLQGYGDTTTDEINAAIQAAPDAFISVGMATTFFTQQLNAAGIEFSDIDSFTKSNGEAITSGKLVYLAGKYSSSVGPAFALIMNAINGNIVRDADGNAVSISQNYQVATDEATFDEFYKTDNGDNPIYNKETLDKIIGDSVTCDDITKLVESK